MDDFKKLNKREEAEEDTFGSLSYGTPKYPVPIKKAVM